MVTIISHNDHDGYISSGLLEEYLSKTDREHYTLNLNNGLDRQNRSIFLNAIKVSEFVYMSDYSFGYDGALDDVENAIKNGKLIVIDHHKSSWPEEFVEKYKNSSSFFYPNNVNPEFDWNVSASYMYHLMLQKVKFKDSLHPLFHLVYSITDCYTVPKPLEDKFHELFGRYSKYIPRGKDLLNELLLFKESKLLNSDLKDFYDMAKTISSKLYDIDEQGLYLYYRENVDSGSNELDIKSDRIIDKYIHLEGEFSPKTINIDDIDFFTYTLNTHFPKSSNLCRIIGNKLFKKLSKEDHIVECGHIAVCTIKDSNVNFTLYRSRRDEVTDLSLIAKNLGGGGHPGASGFNIHIDLFRELLSS